MSSAWPLVLLATNVQFDRSLIRDPGEHGVVGLLHAIVEKVSAARRAILDIELRDGVAGIGIGEVREQSAQRRRHAGSHGLAVSRRCVGSMVGRRYRCHWRWWKPGP